MIHERITMARTPAVRRVYKRHLFRSTLQDPAALAFPRDHETDTSGFDRFDGADCSHQDDEPWWPWGDGTTTATSNSINVESNGSSASAPPEGQRPVTYDTTPDPVAGPAGDHVDIDLTGGGQRPRAGGRKISTSSGRIPSFLPADVVNFVLVRPMEQW